MANKTTAHQRYRNQAGDIVPGVTTIIGVLNKPALVKWANNLGLMGISSDKFRDDAADVGTLSHSLILSYFREENADTSEYSKEQIDKAENAFLYFLDWAKGKKIIPIKVEHQLVSENMQVGGCLDFYGTVDGELLLCDFKTGFIGKEAIIQLGAYSMMLEENGHEPIAKGIILGIPRKETENFREVTLGKGIIAIAGDTFKDLRRVYESLKILDKSGTI